MTNLENLADAGEVGGTDNVVQEEIYRLRRSGFMSITQIPSFKKKVVGHEHFRLMGEVYNSIDESAQSRTSFC